MFRRHTCTLLLALLAVLFMAGKPLVPKHGIARVPFEIVPTHGVYEPTISDNGRWVAFRTFATNVIPEGSDFNTDIYLVDTKKGDIVRVSRTLTGDDPTGDCQSPVISPTGRFVAYRTSDPNIVSNDDLNTNDLFLFDRIKETTVRVSVALNGAGVSKPATSPSISKNGRWVVFSTAASLVVSGDSNNVRDVFLRDMKLGITSILSVTSTGDFADAESDNAKISSNGRFVVFESLAALLPEDDNNAMDIYYLDLKLGTMEIVSVTPEGMVGNSVSSDPDLSANGRWVTFASTATDIVPGAVAFPSVFRRDMKKNITEVASSDADGNPSTSISSTHSISPDGRFVAIGSLGTDFGPEDLNFQHDIYLKDMKKGTIERVTLGPGGEETDGSSVAPQVSKKGKFIAFESAATMLLATEDGNVAPDVYVARP